MGDLRAVSNLVIHTSEGDREIQLLFGDITQLTVEEKVDVIMVSAFAGDYSATPTSVIGALKRKLDLSVRNLARDRQEDLRKSFYCWWSKPLPREMPYRRLLCFERPPCENAHHPAQLVGDVFRALFPAFNNQESTVITPLLATGDQYFSESVMLNAMVDAACKWIKHGLPLKCLKIVIYRGHDEIQKEFETLKKYWESVTVESKEPSIVYDVYISYCNQDKDKVQELQNLLKSEKEDIRIFAEHQELDQEAVFQDRIYDVMITCVKVITVLSPAYLQSQDCLEQFNVALCCDRKTKREMLAPFYVETIPALPTYMCMVQYIDVRINEESTTSLITGCKVFISYLNDIVQDSSAHTEMRTRELAYDVFISYSHRNTEYATELFSIIQRLNPELRIFIDRNELTLGNFWQQTLYHAIDGSKCLIALISPEYLNSLVCTEEYNLALAKHMCWKTSDDSEFFIVPICISDLPNLKKMSAYIPIIDGRYEFSKVITKVAASVDRWINKSIFDENVMSKVEQDGFSLCNIMEDHRTKVCKDAYKQIQADLEKGFQGNLDKEKYHIGVSYTRDASRYAEYLNKRIQLLAPELKTTFEVTNDANLVSALEEVDVIIALLSPAYTVTRKTMDEFHHALGRHRIDKQGPVLYPVQIQSLPFKPLFFHLVPCNVNLEDKLWKNTSEILYWEEMVKAPDAHLDSDKRKELKKVSEMLLDHELMALSYACNDIVNIIRRQRSGELQPETQNTVLENIVRIDMDNIDTTRELAMQVLTAEKQVFKRLPGIQVGSISEKSELTNEQTCKMSDGEILSEKSAQADDPKSTKTSTGSQSETKQEYVESAILSSTPQSTKATENSDKHESKNGSKRDISREESQVELNRSSKKVGCCID